MEKTMRRYFLLALLISLILFMLLTIYFVHERFRDYALDSLDNSMQAVMGLVDPTEIEPSAFVKDLMPHLPSSTRITLVDQDGVVLADSKFQNHTLENHLERVEIQGALTKGFGEDARFSATDQAELLYVARPYGPYILRFSMPLREVRDFAYAMVPLLFLILLFVFFCVSMLTRRLSKRIVKAFNTLLDYMQKMIINKTDATYYEAPFEELRDIFSYFQELTDKTLVLMNQLQDKNEEIHNILSTMEQGFLLLDTQLNVLLLNRKAKDYLGIDNSVLANNITYHYRKPDFVDALKDMVKTKKSAYLDIAENGQVYRFLMAPAGEKGYTVLISDVTEISNLERIRRDFVANVSHELKTPLTSISGFSDLIVNGLVKEQDAILRYNQKIREEANRLVRLADDLLLLSSMENAPAGNRKEEYSPINLRCIFEKVFEILSIQMQEKSISFSIESELTLLGLYEDFYTLIFNLAENAVKYNEQNGAISVVLFQKENVCGFSIADTGIGIPLEDKDRIFERFYRADKGRSRETGGTGLGLSIAKHVVVLYGGTIEADILEKGTKFTIRFPYGPQAVD